jgi:hypothetical protein
MLELSLDNVDQQRKAEIWKEPERKHIQMYKEKTLSRSRHALIGRQN